jgi:hypothetical protein
MTTLAPFNASRRGQMSVIPVIRSQISAHSLLVSPIF